MRLFVLVALLAIVGALPAQSLCDGCTRTLTWSDPGPLTFGITITYGQGCSDGFCQFEMVSIFAGECNPEDPCELAFFDINITGGTTATMMEVVTQITPSSSYVRTTIPANQDVAFHIGGIGDPQTELNCGSKLPIIRNIGGLGGGDVYIECPECVEADG
ncbi:MAG: hypothetical protein KAI24_02200 [Planctomycetes bacterium]|nr:hypothetical protein [Planctomycetota bacterium]